MSYSGTSPIGENDNIDNRDFSDRDRAELEEKDVQNTELQIIITGLREKEDLEMVRLRQVMPQILTHIRFILNI